MHMRKIDQMAEAIRGRIEGISDEQDQLIDTKSCNSGSSHYALQGDWPVDKEEKHHSCDHSYNLKWELDAPSTRDFHQSKDQIKPERQDKEIGPGSYAKEGTPNQRSGPGSTSRRIEVDDAQNPNKESGSGSTQHRNTVVYSRNPNQQ